MHRRALRTLKIASVERREIEKSFCASKIYPNTLYSEITRPHADYSAIVIPTPRGEWTSHRTSSQRLHTCLQRSIRSCRAGEFRNGWSRQFLKQYIDCRVVQNFWWKSRKNCCFQIRTINEFVSLDIQGYRYSFEQRSCLLTLYIQVQFWVSLMEFVSTCPLKQNFPGNWADFWPKNWILFWIYRLLLGGHNAALPLVHKNGTTQM